MRMALPRFSRSGHEEPICWSKSVGSTPAARGINILRELVQLVAFRVRDHSTLRGAAVGGERDTRGAARARERRRVGAPSCAGEEEEGGRAHVCAMPVLWT